MPPKPKEHPILVALIGAAAAITVGILSYLGATGGFSDSTFDYTGVVRNVTKQPVAFAKVGIAEDQKVPQHVLTDSEGVFHVRLLKKTLSVHVEVQAEGYEPYSLTVQPSRTGSEDILLTPQKAAQNEISKPDSVAHSTPILQTPGAKATEPQPSPEVAYQAARVFLTEHMNPALPFPRSTDCCIESYAYAFLGRL